MDRFFDFADGVERILLRQFLNPLLWFMLIVTVYFEVLLNQVQRQATRWPTEVLLAHLTGIIELSLLVSVVAILLWEVRIRSRAEVEGKRPAESAEGYPPRLWLAMCLLLVLVTIVHVACLGHFQYVHFLTVSQRALFLCLTTLLVPGLYLVLNPRLRGGFAALSSFVASLAAYSLVELGILWLSIHGSENAFFTRLNDVYYWNQLFPEYARKELWLTVYSPWLLWYLLMYFALNAIVLIAVISRARGLSQKGAAE